MPILKENPSLIDFQNYVVQLELERGFASQDAIQKSLLLGEEVGELFKVIRKSQGLNIDPKSKIGSIGEEIADILIYLCSIANRFDINIEQAFRAKEEINKTRSWK